MRISIHAGLASSLINFRGPLVKTLCDVGYDVHAIAPELLSDEKTRSQLESWGVTVHELRLHRAGINPLKDVVTFFDYVRLLRKIRPDVTLGYTIKPVIYGNLAAWLTRLPLRFALITGLGYAFTGEATGKRKLIQHLARSLYSQALKRCKKVFFQNPDDEALFRQLGLVPSSVHTQVVNGSGVDTEQFALVELPDGSPVFLLIARLLGDKGVREYVQAARKVRREYAQARFVLVGSLDPNPDSISKAELDGWVEEGVIEYPGRLDDVRPAIAASTVYVLPSYREGTPRTVLEAMSMGRAIITTDAPGCRETVIEGENGFLVPIKDADALAKAMIRFIEQPELIASMGKRSREIAEQKYDVEIVNRQMLEGMGLA